MRHAISPGVSLSALGCGLGLALALAAGPVAADDRADLTQLRDTVLNLVDALVQQGVLDKEKAAALVAKAQADAARSTPAVAAAESNATALGEASAKASSADGKPVVRVTYVPEFVKDEIKAQLRNEMRRDVVADVTEQAKKERWGTPNALPAWISSIKLSGDARIRNEYDYYGSDNAETLGGQNLYLNILNVNKAGSLKAADTRAFLNTSEDNNRWRERVRLGLSAKIADYWTFDTRLVTGTLDNPVSANLTQGTMGNRLQVQLDRAQVRYDRPDDRGFNWLSVQLGRISNPWFGTELVWDEDLGFDGIAATYRYRLAFGDDEAMGAFSSNRTVWLTGGAFPLQQPEFQSQDRWLVAGQAGLDWEFDNQNKLRVGAAVYDYLHMAGKRNPLFSTINNGTAVQFAQKGNLLFNLANDPNQDGATTQELLFGLAADYRLLDVNVSYDFANLAPYHVILNADVVKNLAFDEQDVQRRTGGLTYLYPVRDRTLGALVGLQFGWPEVKAFGAWSVAVDYRYLQRDAVLDAFTDSDFHLGGTDTQGYRITALYGLTKNLWMRGRWMSANEIDGPPLAIDVLQVDLNARF